jgi:hypothetical protein
LCIRASWTRLRFRVFFMERETDLKASPLFLRLNFSFVAMSSV